MRQIIIYFVLGIIFFAFFNTTGIGTYFADFINISGGIVSMAFAITLAYLVDAVTE
tara:strand:+ start:2261 stop:2428 length:168 start_codon:yes stop_codon:yes gene_type:complete